MMSCYKRADLLSFRIIRKVREVVVSAKERCSGMKIISPLCIAMVLLALGSLFHVSTTEPVHVGLRMLRGIKATTTSGATTQTINVDETEFVHAGSMGFVLKDYPSSGATQPPFIVPWGLQMKGRADNSEPHTDVNCSFLGTFWHSQASESLTDDQMSAMVVVACA